MEERADAEIRVDALELRRIDRTVGEHRERAEVDALGHHAHRLGPAGRRARLAPAAPCSLVSAAPLVRVTGLLDRAVTDRAQLDRHLVGEHLLEPEPEEVRRIPAVGARHHVATEAGRAARAPVTARAAVDEPGSERARLADVAIAVRVDPRPEALADAELALEELATAADGTRGVALDQIHGGAVGELVTVPLPDLFPERLAHVTTRHRRKSLQVFGELRESGCRDEDENRETERRARHAYPPCARSHGRFA